MELILFQYYFYHEKTGNETHTELLIEYFHKKKDTNKIILSLNKIIISSNKSNFKHLQFTHIFTITFMMMFIKNYLHKE